MGSLKRTSLTLDENLIIDLDYVGKRLGVSRSALLSNLASQAVSDLRALLEEMPEDPNERDVKRFKGASIDLINERLQGLEEIRKDGDIFKG